MGIDCWYNYRVTPCIATYGRIEQLLRIIITILMYILVIALLPRTHMQAFIQDLSSGRGIEAVSTYGVPPW